MKHFKVGDLVRVRNPLHRKVVHVSTDGWVGLENVTEADARANRSPSIRQKGHQWLHNPERLELVKAAPKRWRVCTLAGIHLGTWPAKDAQMALVAHFRAEGHTAGPHINPMYVNVFEGEYGTYVIPLTLFRITEEA